MTVERGRERIKEKSGGIVLYQSFDGYVRLTPSLSPPGYNGDQ